MGGIAVSGEDQFVLFQAEGPVLLECRHLLNGVLDLCRTDDKAHFDGTLTEQGVLDKPVDDLLFDTDLFRQSLRDRSVELVSQPGQGLFIGLLVLLKGDILTVNGDCSLIAVHHPRSYSPENEDQGNDNHNCLHNSGLSFISEYLKHE